MKSFNGAALYARIVSSHDEGRSLPVREVSMGPRFTRGLCRATTPRWRPPETSFQWGRALRADCVLEQWTHEEHI